MMDDLDLVFFLVCFISVFCKPSIMNEALFYNKAMF